LKLQIQKGRKEQELARRQMAEYQARVDAVPRIEQMQNEMAKDYETTKQNYQSLLAKKKEAGVAANLERRKTGEQFRILDPANLPEKPAKPNRLLLTAVAFLLGLGLGLAAVLGWEMFANIVQSERELKRLSSLPILASIPILPAESIISRKKKVMSSRRFKGEHS